MFGIDDAVLAAAIPAIVGAVGNGVGGAIGGGAASGDRARQRQLMEQIIAQYGNIDVPTMERIAAEQQGPTAYEGIQTDPRMRAEQLSSLEQLKSIASQGGETAVDRAALARMLDQVGRQEGAGRNAIMGNMRARGVAGSGAELAAALQNQQGSADRAQTAGLDQASAAQRRMLEAILQKGQMAGQIHGEDYREQSDLARARDMLSNYNVGARSRAQYYNAGLPAQQFGMQMQKANGVSGALKGGADYAGQTADRTANMWSGIGQTVGQTGATAADRLASQPAATPAASTPAPSYTDPYRDTTDQDGVPYYLRKP